MIYASAFNPLSRLHSIISYNVSHPIVAAVTIVTCPSTLITYRNTSRMIYKYFLSDLTCFCNRAFSFILSCNNTLRFAALLIIRVNTAISSVNVCIRCTHDIVVSADFKIISIVFHLPFLFICIISRYIRFYWFC